MSPIVIFQVLFLTAAFCGAVAHAAGKPWGATVSLFGLTLFCFVLLIGGR